MKRDERMAGITARKIATPEEISRGEFANLDYQLDAVRRGLECLEKYDGVIMADVVGLGKSVIAATIGYNMVGTGAAKIVIIAPPHLGAQWERYVEKFQLRNTRVVSSGKLEELYREVAQTSDLSNEADSSLDDGAATLYIIDEAHRYRNENTAAYRMLHQLVRAQPQNKVMLLTATPYNNHPRDVYALLKLFQIPGRTTLEIVDNLSLRFGQLIAEYNQLERLAKKKMTPEIETQMDVLAEKMRTVIEPVLIRRSRVDLVEEKKYAEDLARQKISFAKIAGPELISYSLGGLTELYYRTLEDLDAGKFRGAKYKPLTYLADEAKFNAEYEKIFSFNRTQQLNMAKLARRLFVLRFESSQYAFRRTLENMIAAHRATLELWHEKKLVAISKNKSLDKLDGAEDEVFTIPRELLEADFAEEVAADLAWLERMHREWFAEMAENADDMENSIGRREVSFDPKQERVEITLRELLRENPERKIVVFTSFTDTAQYVVEKLQKGGLTRTLLYTSTGNQALKNTVTRNFDAALSKDERADDYDIIVATDALSEGFNLHRAGVIINYDIPYNPTRVVQRIGRINRIDRRMFEELKIYNMFPTTIGEEIVNIKGISSLKMLLMNQVIGNDTKILTEDEDIESFFRRQYQEASAEKQWLSGKRAAKKITGPYELPKMLGNRGYALDVIEALREVCEGGGAGVCDDVYEGGKIYLDKLYNVVRKYDDLCEAELQIIAQLDLTSAEKAMRELRTEIPEWYLDAIAEKVWRIEKTQGAGMMNEKAARVEDER